jgi:hypothetical protein
VSRPQFLPFALPDIGEEEIGEVVDTLRSPWLSSGPKVAAFERDFAAYIGSKHARAVNSGTAALHLALDATGIQGGTWSSQRRIRSRPRRRSFGTWAPTHSSSTLIQRPA